MENKYISFKFRYNDIFLIQTDTTVGFLSKDINSIYRAKKIKIKKKILLNISNLNDISIRVRKTHKKMIRRAKKTTFILDNNSSFRVCKEGLYGKFLSKNGIFYSSSANITTKKFDQNIAEESANIVVKNRFSFSEKRASTIIKIYKNKYIKIR